MAYGTSFDGEPAVADIWIPGSAGATAGSWRSDLRLVQGRLTTKVGHLLAPMAVRYVVIPNHNGPPGSGAVAVAHAGSALDLRSAAPDRPASW